MATALEELTKRRKALQALNTPAQVGTALASTEPAQPRSLLATASAEAPAAPAAPAAPGVTLSQASSTPAPATATPRPQQQPRALTSSYTGAAGTGDPRDEIYWADVAKAAHSVNMGNAPLQEQETQAGVTKGRVLGDLSRKHSTDVMTTKQRASAGGRLYSTSLGNELSTEQEAYLRNTFDTEEDYENAIRAITVQKKLLEDGYTVEEAVALAAAGYRYADKKRQEALLAATTTAAAAAAPAAAPTPAQQSQQAAIAAGWTPAQAQGGHTTPAGKPGPHYVWSPQQYRWVYTGPSPGKNYYWTGTHWKKK